MPAKPQNRNFFRSKARITATRWARSRSATLICFTKVIPACCSRRTRSCRRIAIAVRSIARKPERADAREYRKCNWECVGLVEKKFAAQKKKGNPYAAFVFEPLIQGAAGMIPQPRGLAAAGRRKSRAATARC